jgi:hypothetical protein
MDPALQTILASLPENPIAPNSNLTVNSSVSCDAREEPTATLPEFFTSVST